MKTLQFKTNINCGGCVRGVTPSLDGHDSIKSWKVDLQSDDRILTVEVEDSVTPAEVSRTVSEAGFSAQPLERA
ncbi:heavy-metal-associated domain-containing protein [Lewinella sp. JB7]|uniref:heavy-metal-associated domain-containing protein n=1 Tax=Lewinella sp. JB7 TaxID=2962887 RepID=UPI0020C94957|nr:heavy metal-associated domain-containing protein [Lewinella sp. JB7]MCP9236318.1 heavy-metal-associated domain-containing protein [Lewinella sp. JB7]